MIRSDNLRNCTANADVLIATVQAAAEAQDRMREREAPARPAWVAAFSRPNDATAPAYHGISASERGQWDRLRAQGFSGYDAAKIIRDARP